MTPAEKSDELYLKYKEALNIQNDMQPGKNPFAQKCAIICVEQIIEAIHDRLDSSIEELNTRYWKGVLEHLKNS
jgi:hypothetical protein